MKVICCYVKGRLCQETRESVKRYTRARFIDTAGDDENYWRTIQKYWKGKHDLVIIEQDMLIDAATVPSFEACAEPWCSFGYAADPPDRRRNTYLGCTKFSAQLQQMIPASSFCKSVFVKGGWIPWFRLDLVVSSTLLGEGFKPHDHGDICHLHEYGRL